MWKDPHLYFRSTWNFVDVLSILISGSGFVTRLVASKSPWGRSLYALSAPFMFSRILSFASVLPFQGPLIQVSWCGTSCRGFSTNFGFDPNGVFNILSM